MESFGRLLVRLLVVPLGYLAAVLAGSCVIMFGSWFAGDGVVTTNPGTFVALTFGIIIAAPMLVIVTAASMWLPAAIAVLIAEAFAIRTWIYYALGGAVCAWVGWQRMSSFDDQLLPINEPRYVIAAGIAGGFAYWAVAGWSAGFWKPVFRRPPAAAPADNPFNPPARTEA